MFKTQRASLVLTALIGFTVVSLLLANDQPTPQQQRDTANKAAQAGNFKDAYEAIRKVVLDMIGAFPKDLAALGAAEALRYTRGDGHAASAEDIRLFETSL